MIINFPMWAMNNRQSVETSQTVGCYYCLKIFDPKEIKEYTDHNKTVICPYCAVDSVISDKNCKLTEELLEQGQKFWFEPRQKPSLGS